MVKRDNGEKGVAMLEFVLVLPILLLLFFLILQFAQLWMAKHLVYYASYTAARSALVYNVEEYRNGADSFKTKEGPLYLSAVTVLSWLDAKAGKSDFTWFPKEGSTVWDRVRIEGTDAVDGDGKKQYVSVTVHYLCPLMMPLASELLAYSISGGAAPEDFPPEDYGSVTSSIENYNAGDSVPSSAIYKTQDSVFLMHLKSTCIMPKRYSTSTYPKGYKHASQNAH